jgi:hypothetical protein
MAIDIHALRASAPKFPKRIDRAFGWFPHPTSGTATPRTHFLSFLGHPRGHAVLLNESALKYAALNQGCQFARIVQLASASPGHYGRRYLH